MRDVIRSIVWMSCLVTLGCTPAPDDVVTGIITFRGEPVKAGAVEIASETTSVTYVADLLEDGSFVFQFPIGRRPPPGRYRIAVKPPRGNKPSLEYQPPRQVRPEDYPNIPRRFHDATTSNLSLDITALKKTECRFDLSEKYLRKDGAR